MFFIEPIWVRIAAIISLFLYLFIAVMFVMLRWRRGFPYPRCPGCSYALTGLTIGQCPECGFDLVRRGVYPPGKPSVRVWLLGAGVWTSIICWPTAYLIDYSMRQAGVYSIYDIMEIFVGPRSDRVEVTFYAMGNGLVPPWSSVKVPLDEVSMSLRGIGNHRHGVKVTVDPKNLGPTPASVAQFARLGVTVMDLDTIHMLIDREVKLKVARADAAAIAICLDEVRNSTFLSSPPRQGSFSQFLNDNQVAFQQMLNGGFVHAHFQGMTHKVSDLWWAWIPGTAMMALIWGIGLWAITRLWRRCSRRPWKLDLSSS